MSYDEALYWASVLKRDVDDCWLWTGRVNVDGYGMLGNKTKATHVALFMDGRPRLGSMQANHTCDTPACCNPRHLYWGTQRENIADMVARGRFRRMDGEHNTRARLTDAQVAMLRQEYADGDPIRELLDRYGIAASTLQQIVNGRLRPGAGGPVQPKLKRGQIRRSRAGYRDRP